ncbi:hypothetical protein ACWDOR_29930 [Streptosporangium canum]|uniref:hypothetical protein n=1 Tax=Streptosporangium canum TaxID=324952 RepID=UPI0037BA69DD
MDEITLLGRAIPDVPPPSTQAVARARARLSAGTGPARSRSGWAWALAAASATVAVAVTVTFAVAGADPEPPSSVSPVKPPSPATSVEPPSGYEGLKLLRSRTMATSATKVTLRFRPTSTDTAIMLRCAEPGSVVFTYEARKNGASSSGGVCGPDGMRSKHDDKRYEPGWADRTHTVTFWVFPPDAPILKGRESLNCRAEVCDGRYVLRSPENADRLAAALGDRPGAWSVAVYDAPAG